MFKVLIICYLILGARSSHWTWSLLFSLSNPRDLSISIFKAGTTAVCTMPGFLHGSWDLRSPTEYFTSWTVPSPSPNCCILMVVKVSWMTDLAWESLERLFLWAARKSFSGREQRELRTLDFGAGQSGFSAHLPTTALLLWKGLLPSLFVKYSAELNEEKRLHQLSIWHRRRTDYMLGTELNILYGLLLLIFISPVIVILIL